MSASSNVLFFSV